jgi:hypothetical protein
VLYTRNAAGLPLTIEEQDRDEDDYRIFRTYDEQGNELTSHQVYLEGASAGVMSMCSASTFDECGNQLTDSSDPECDDSALSDTAWSYDCFGQ